MGVVFDIYPALDCTCDAVHFRNYKGSEGLYYCEAFERGVLLNIMKVFSKSIFFFKNLGSAMFNKFSVAWG